MAEVPRSSRRARSAVWSLLVVAPPPRASAMADRGAFRPRQSVTSAPGGIGVVGDDRRRYLGRLGAEIGLEDVALVADLEGHHPGLAVLLRPGEQAEARDHVAVDHVVVGAAGGMLGLPLEDAVVVATIGIADAPCLQAAR